MTNLKTFPFRALLTFVVIFADVHQLHALPEKGAWRDNAAGTTTNLEPGVDRIFLVDRGWAVGKLLAVTGSSVRFEEDGQTHELTRSQVSLIELNDWLHFEKRIALKKDTYKVLIKIESTAKHGDLLFPKGTVVKVKSFEYVRGKDNNDKLGYSQSGLWFDKGKGDFSLTTIEAVVEILPGNEKSLLCEISNHQYLSRKGYVNYSFHDPDNIEHVFAALPENFVTSWCEFDLPLAKLTAPSRNYRCRLRTRKEMNSSSSFTLEALPTVPTMGSPPLARVISNDDRILICHVLAVDEKMVHLQLASNKSTKLPRAKIRLIELYDWEKLYNKDTADGLDSSHSGPISVAWVGPCGELTVRLNEGSEIGSLISPPHAIVGRDQADEGGYMPSDVSFKYHPGFFDCSHLEVQSIFTVRLLHQATILSSTITKPNSGHVAINFIDPIRKKKFWASPSSMKRATNWDFKLRQSKLPSID